jgi:hypothetical protein
LQGTELYKELEAERDNLLREFEANGYNYILPDTGKGCSEEDLEETMQYISAISELNERMRELSDESVNAISQDSILDINKLKTWYETVHTPIDKYLLAETHLFTNDYEMSDAVLSQIPSMFVFEESEQLEYDNYMSFYNLKKQVQLTERDWSELEEDEIYQLQSIAELNTGRSSTMAKGVLCFFYNICYENDYDIDIPNETPEISPKSTSTDLDEVIFTEDIIKENLDNIKRIEVYDISGRLVYQIKENKAIDFAGLPSGIYIVKIYTKDLKVRSHKFIKP